MKYEMKYEIPTKLAFLTALLFCLPIHPTCSLPRLWLLAENSLRRLPLAWLTTCTLATLQLRNTSPSHWVSLKKRWAELNKICQSVASPYNHASLLPPSYTRLILACTRLGPPAYVHKRVHPCELLWFLTTHQYLSFSSLLVPSFFHLRHILQ